MDGSFPQRKTNRLPNYDYSTPGAYFLTICTVGKRCILSEITVGGGVLDAPSAVLSEKGKIVDAVLLDIIAHYPALTLDHYVIMPNHIHLLLMVSESGTSRTPSPTGANELIPRFISTFKRFTNKACGEELWQRSYHDHVIRNDRDYEEIWRYIDNNPARWLDDSYAPGISRGTSRTPSPTVL